MRPPSPTRSPPRLSLASVVLTLLVALLAMSATPPVSAAPEGPKPDLTHTLFDNLPSRIMYFDDSPVVLYHDQIGRNVLRSADEGRRWDHINGVPKGEALMLIEHPYDASIAFILTSATTHYRTMNRGETWQSFVTPLAPSLGSNTLGFHAKRWDWILFTGQSCEDMGGWRGRLCHDETFYTKDAFATAPKPLLAYTTRCIFAHDKKEYAAFVPDELIYCAAFEPPSTSSASTSLSDAFSSLLGGPRTLKESRLYSSTDFFENDHTFVDLGIGKEARGVVGIGGVQKYLVAALKPSAGRETGGGSNSGSGEMVLYVTEDGETWSRAQFPHGHGLRENAYTIVESTPHSLLIDVNSSPSAAAGTLFTSNSNGTYFVRSLENTNRNKMGIVDFEKIVSVEGVAIVNTVMNVEAVEAGQAKELKTRITFDDGGHWSLIKAPATDNEGRKVKCDVDDIDSCSLHLHSVTQPHNYGRVFSSTAPGLVMGVGTIGRQLLPYDECDTFVSTDAGLSWRMVDDGAKKYEFGDQGSLLVMIEDEEPTDEIKYSWDFGKTWQEFDLGVKLRARLLTTVPDSTSLKFILLGTLTRKSKDKGSQGERHVVVHMDFETLGKRKCSEGDMEKWYARTLGGKPDCLMGHKQWFMRRKQDADCVVAEKWKDPVGREENCPCDDEDYECDYNFAPDGMGNCVLVGPESIPPGQCLRDGDKFRGSSGFRLIPGNTCDVSKGIKKDEQVMKPCHAGQETPGLVTHQAFTFPGLVLDQAYFGDSHTILAFTNKNRVWQSSNEGFSWHEVVNGAHIVAMTMHAYSRDRAYLITESRTVHYSTDKGNSWNRFTAPADPNGFGVPLLDFHPLRSDWLIWTGQKDCDDASSDGSKCRAVAYYTKNNGRDWYEVDEYVRVCSWGRDKKLRIDEKIIFCESYRDKKGSQRAVYANNNPLQLVRGEFFYGTKHTVFESIVGFATFEEYMVVAEVYENTRAIGLKVSMDGKTFALARFPPNMHLENQAYTVLESTTDSVFLHVTTHADIGSEWGTLFKSNWNGTYYSPSLDHVNRNGKGFVDFEKMIGLDGIAVINVVSNPDEAALSSNKKLQTRITHNDGGRWKPMNPPAKDALGRAYDCSGTNCALHIHGYTERKDPRATYSSPSAVGLMLAVGNVGEYLVPYADSDTFLTRDGGFTWEEVHKDAHMWEYGDQGSILVLANDEDVTDHVTFTLNEGLTWQDYVFGEPIRVRSIVTVPMDTSRKFILFGTAPDKPESTLAIHLDFSSITNVKCKLDLASPDSDDFELWSPSESRDEPCLFGMQALYHRRIRNRNCFVGERLPQPHKIEKYCPCTADDFECEFNHRRDSRGDCVPVPGAAPLEADQTCAWDQPFWYDRTAYRKVPHSKCEGGLALDKGSRHVCAGHSTRGGFFWATIAVLPFGIAALAAVWWARRRGGGKGRIRLPEPGEGNRSGLAELLISIPWFVVGVVGAVVSYARELEIPWLSDRLRRRNSSRGYRSLRLEDAMDAELLGDYDDEL
ncbi:hypothetical protein JCM1841_004702 [Sporobolomyces salmonicolor]